MVVAVSGVVAVAVAVAVSTDLLPLSFLDILDITVLLLLNIESTYLDCVKQCGHYRYGMR